MIPEKYKSERNLMSMREEHGWTSLDSQTCGARRSRKDRSGFKGTHVRPGSCVSVVDAGYQQAAIDQSVPGGETEIASRCIKKLRINRETIQLLSSA
jgi:hypothetical protein